MTAHISQNTLADDLGGRLVNAIVAGDIAQGAKISEAELAARFGVSRGPLREAMRTLEGLRLIERRPHAGARVITLNCEQLSEIFTIREALEGMAARLAAQRMSDEAITALQQLLVLHERRVQESGGRDYFHQEGDLDFHLRILEGSGNRRLYQLLGGDLYHLIRMYRRQSSQTHSRPLIALSEHRHICDAISQRDGELAELLMRRHIQGARRNLESCIEEQANERR